MKQRKMYREPRVEWMKPRIKSMIWNVSKKEKTIRTTRRKENPKK